MNTDVLDQETPVRVGRRAPFKQLPDAVMDDDRLHPLSKLAYWYLKRIAGYDDARARVSISKLAVKLGYAPASKRSARTHIDELVSAGWVEVVRRRSPDGRTNLVSEYVVHDIPEPGGVGAAQPLGGGCPAPGVGAPQPRCSRRGSSVEGSSVEKPSADTSAATVTDLFGEATPSSKARSKQRPEEPPSGFEEFWTVYGHKVGKGDAVKAWAKAHKKTDPRTIIAAAAGYAASRRGQDPQYTAHPASWLNAERWTDEPTVTGGNAARGGTDRRGSGHQPYRDTEDESMFAQSLN